MTRKILIMVTAAIFAAGLIAAGFTDAGAGYSQGGAFKSTDYGARAWGMGGAGVAGINDEGAVYWNPAMMALLPSHTAGASYINLVKGTTARQSQVAYAHVLEKSERDDVRGVVARHAIGALYTNLSLDIQGGTGYSENTLRVAYAFTPDYFISFGLAGDVFMSSADVEGFDAAGTSVDAALRISLLEDLTVGLVMRNAFSRYSYDDGTDFRRERVFVAGASTTLFRQVKTQADLIFAHGDLARAIIGAETDYFFEHLALRAGFAAINTGEPRNVPYVGFGVGYDRFHLHYNANLDKETAFESTHRFSLSIAI